MDVFLCVLIMIEVVAGYRMVETLLAHVFTDGDADADNVGLFGFLFAFLVTFVTMGITIITLATR